MIDINSMLTIVGIILGLCFQAILTVNWMNTKFDAHRKMMSDRHDADDKALSAVHRRIDDVKDTYVKRVDLDRDISALHSTLAAIKVDIHSQTSEMNCRLDRLLTMLMDSGQDH